jgi:hypothetical protein
MPRQTTPYEIEIVNGEMVLLDADGNSYARSRVPTYRDAKRTLRAWMQRYAVKVGECYRRIDEYFSNPTNQ